jgi:FkbM family methyltransferase
MTPKRVLRAIKRLLPRAPSKLTFSEAVNCLRAAVDQHGSFSLTIEASGVWMRLASGLWLKYTDEFNSVTSLVARYGGFEFREIALLAANLPERALVLDIGANVGYYALSLALPPCSARVVAFEPVARTAGELLENATRNGVGGDQLIVERLAVGERNEPVWITTAHHSSNYLVSGSSSEVKEQVACVRLDSFIATHHLGPVHAMKIDVEGGELGVVSGARDLLERDRPLILAELTEHPSQFGDRVCSEATEVVSLLLGLGYRGWVLDDRATLLPLGERARGQFSGSYHNYFFSHAELRQPHS